MTDSRWFSHRIALAGFSVAFLTELLMQIVLFDEPFTAFVVIRGVVQGAVLGTLFYFVFPIDSTEE